METDISSISNDIKTSHCGEEVSETYDSIFVHSDVLDDTEQSAAVL